MRKFTIVLLLAVFSATASGGQVAEERCLQLSVFAAYVGFHQDQKVPLDYMTNHLLKAYSSANDPSLRWRFNRLNFDDWMDMLELVYTQKLDGELAGNAVEASCDRATGKLRPVSQAARP